VHVDDLGQLAHKLREAKTTLLKRHKKGASIGMTLAPF